MRRASLRTGVFVLSLTLICAVHDASAFDVEVGEKRLDIPVPAGFVEGTALSASARTLAEQLTPSMNRLLAFFLSEEDAARISRGEEPTWQRYMMVQIEHESEPHRLSPEEFFQVRHVITAQQETLRANVAVEVKRLRDALSSNGVVDVPPGQMLPLGIFSEDESHISMATMSSYQASGTPDAQDLLVASGASVIFAGNKIVFAYVYARFDDRSDLEWVKSTSKAWAREIVEANPSTARQWLDWTRLGRATIWGALVGALLAVALLLWKRRRTRR